MKDIKTIALVAPSGNIKDFNLLNKQIKILEKNFKIKKYYDEKTSNNYLSDNDLNRTKFFENAFLDDEVDMIISIRGGYGAIRIIDKIDYNKIKNSNKIYLGSSDASILLIALYKNTNIKCFHSLMITNGFVENINQNLEIIKNETFKINYETISKGNLKGHLWGGNLSSVVSLLSYPNLILDKDIILFLEDLNEPVYKIDKMLYEIFRCEKLKQNIKGIIFGDFYHKKEEIFPLLKEYSKIFNTPSVLSFDITHKNRNITLPFGKYIELEA